MAFPRVFISSTCYDLGEIRDSLFEFISNYHFEPVLSERGEIFYHPDLHTHESCIRELDNCHLLILIIGGRFGGEYKVDKKSITNAEYLAARKLNIPVFTFVKREVFEDHRVFGRNSDKKDIVYPSIEKQEYSRQIFDFINDVRLSDTNNGFFPFEYAKDIKDKLGKQWAGMLYSFLLDRQKHKEQSVTNRLIENISLISKKTEEILENIYKKVDEKEAEKQIEKIDNEISASRFFSHLKDSWHEDNTKIKLTVKHSIKNIASQDLSNTQWHDFIINNFEGFELDKSDPEYTILWYRHGSGIGTGYIISRNGKGFIHVDFIDKNVKYYEIYKNLNQEQKIKVLRSSIDLN
jgi:hypothetical protein